MPLSRPQPGWRPRIERAVAGLGSSVDESAIAKLERLLDLVVEWNARVDLTAARNADELVDLYLADAVTLAAAGIEPGERWVDVGSGGGAPGLVLAIIEPELHLTLVEPRTKRVAFLRSAVGALQLGSVEVQRARSDALRDAGWQVAVSRATLAPADWLVEGARLATRGVWVLLARAEPPSLAGWRMERNISYTWPLTGASRRAARFVPREGSAGGAP